MKHLVTAMLMLSTTACFKVGPALPADQTAHFCLTKTDWPRLNGMLNRFARQHSLKKDTAIMRLPDGEPMLNVNLSGGHNFIFWGTDFDLWITSDPFRESETSLTLIHRDKRPTPGQWKLARNLLDEIHGLTWPISGKGESADCSGRGLRKVPR